MKEKVTIRDVAAECGVSVATVSYVLNGKKKVSEETRQKILSMIEKLGFVPDLNARGLSAKDTRLIGVVVPQTEPGSRLMFHNNFYSEILGGIEYSARQLGYHVIISATDVTEDYLNLIRERNLAGVIIIGTYRNVFYSELRKLEVPVVLVDSYCRYDWFHEIRIDDEYSSYLAAGYVLDRGHTEIALVTGKLKEDGVMQKRLSGFKTALKEKGIAYTDELLFETMVDYESGRKIAEEILKKKSSVTAVVATADVIAIGLMKGFSERRIKIPQDISVMGFDNLEISRYTMPGLTTVGQPIPQKGERAVRLLVENINHHEMKKVEEIMSVQIVERESVRKL